MAEIPCITIDFMTGWKGHYILLIAEQINDAQNFGIWNNRFNFNNSFCCWNTITPSKNSMKAILKSEMDLWYYV